MSVKPFNPALKGSFAITNAVAAAAARTFQCPGQVAFYNTSATATAFVEITPLPMPTDTAVTAVIPTPSVMGGFPVPPGAQIRITASVGPCAISVIASAADGTLYVTPGLGD